ncbi:MAG TPA: SPOR domain-containing protein [Burkholderiales bacterium]|nr:SPOR domain-containing protein [Burkholderiales bacterium]
MRIVFFLLLLANLVFFGWAYFGTGRTADEPQLMEQQLNPQEIRLLTPDQVAKLAAERAKAVADRPKPPPRAPVIACLELGAFNPIDAPRVQQVLGPLALGSRLSQRRADEIASYWVYIPPLRSRQSANLKAAELKKLGVDDFFIVQEDPKFRLAVSLGVFKTEEAANARLAELRKKGVRTARVAPKETPVQKVYFAIREVPDALVAKLNDLRQGFPGTELKDCPAEDRRAAR